MERKHFTQFGRPELGLYAELMDCAAFVGTDECALTFRTAEHQVRLICTQATLQKLRDELDRAIVDKAPNLSDRVSALESAFQDASLASAHEAALARRATAEAALLEFELAEKRRDAGLSDRSGKAGRLRVDGDSGDKSIVIRSDGTEQTGSLELRIDVEQAPWLAEVLLTSYQTLLGGQR